MHAPLVVLAAGSLRAALTAYAEARTDGEPELVFGPAGLLRREVERGRACDVYLSANTAHPEALARATGTTSQVFARNPLCVVARRALALTPDTLLARLLDPALRLGMSTPGADPSGDYALDMFRRAEAMWPGAEAALRAKALAVVGAAIPGPGVPTKEGGIARLFEDGIIDAMICYRTGARALAPGPTRQARDARESEVWEPEVGVPEVGELDLVTPPPALAVTASYGVVVLRAGARAAAFAAGLSAPEGAAILARHGFEPP